jgi:hypothetical protein
LALSKTIASSPFGQAGIFQIRKNLASNLIVIQNAGKYCIMYS